MERKEIDPAHRAVHGTVNVHNSKQVLALSRNWRVSTNDIDRAVEAVGPDFKDVKRWLDDHALHQPELRAEERPSVICPGTLILGALSAPCLIQNMCSKGFLIKYDRELPVEQIVRLEFELSPAQSVECTVQVRHVNNKEYLGAKVLEISDQGKIVFERFLEEKRAAHRNSVTVR